jgi:pantothenate kinase type III
METQSDMKSNKLLAIDIGNSRIKLFDGSNFISFQIKKNPYPFVFDYILSGDFDLIGLSSVNLKVSNEISSFLNKNELEYYNAFDLISVYNKIDFSLINGMGADRRLGLIATETLCSAPFLTIDFGTAITINFVNSDKVCEGGFIIPGLFTQSRALNNFTSALPLTELQFNSSLLGKDTISAINNGILNITLKGIDSYINEMLKSQPIHIIISGGGFNIIKDYSFGFKYNYEPQLVLKGVLSLLEMV